MATPVMDELPDDCRLVPLRRGALALDIDDRKMRRLVASAGIPVVTFDGGRGASLTVANLRKLIACYERRLACP